VGTEVPRSRGKEGRDSALTKIYYCAFCDVEVKACELVDNGCCPYCNTEIPDAVEDMEE
jgi:hypothetical protein